MGDSRLDKSLDEIIKESPRGGRGNGRGGGGRGNNNNTTRGGRGRGTGGKASSNRVSKSNNNASPYSPQQSTRVKLGGPEMSIKVLINNSIAGILIGAGGKNIKEWMEVSHTQIAISNTNEKFPGTDDRIRTIIGRQHAIDYALAILWDANAILVHNNNDEKSVDWHVNISARKTTALDNIDINGTIVIPSEFAGAIIGPGGATIKSISEQSGAKVTMNNKSSQSTAERLIKISGTKGSCVSSTSLILNQLVITALGGDSIQTNTQSSGSASVLAVTLQIAVPNNLVGNIMGKNGSRLEQIKDSTGADITVSGRGEYIEGTQNRLVTITGPSRQAYNAKKMVEECLV